MLCTDISVTSFLKIINIKTYKNEKYKAVINDPNKYNELEISTL